VPNPYAFFGPRVLEGEYTVTLVKGTAELTGSIELVPDPRSPHSAADRRAQHQAVWRLYAMLERLAYVGDTVADAIEQLTARAADTDRDATRQRIEELRDGLERLRSTLVASGGMIEGDEELREKLSGLYGSVNGYEGRPTESQLDRIEVLDDQLETAEARLSELADDLDALNQRLAKRGLDKVTLTDRATWEGQRSTVGG
jgi:DNA repair exonuclease SbcCD ATPase subunit